MKAGIVATIPLKINDYATDSRIMYQIYNRYVSRHVHIVLILIIELLSMRNPEWHGYAERL